MSEPPVPPQPSFWGTVEQQPPSPAPPRRADDPQRGPLRPDRAQRLVLGALGALLALSLLAWLLTGPGAPVSPLPARVDRVRLGMSQSEVRGLGVPASAAEPEAPLELPLPGGDGLRWRASYDAAGRLSAFSVEAGPGASGAPIGPQDVTRLLPLLMGGYPLAQLEEQLGPGVRVKRWLDAQGPVDVFRWEVVLGGRSQGRLEVDVRDGKVLAHRLQDLR